MANEAGHAAENERLRRAVRELAALSALPALWKDLPPSDVLDSLAGALAGALDLELVYVRLHQGAEAVRARRPEAGTTYADAARAVLAAPAALMTDPSGGQPLQVSIVTIGSALGSIVAACARPDFPLEHERLLLEAGANGAATALECTLAEQASRRSEQRFLDFADVAPAMLWVTEPDGTCTFLSRAWYEFTGQSNDQGLGFGWLEAIHPDDRPVTSEAFLAANAARTEFSLEHRLLHADGSCRWVIDMGRPRFDRDGAFLGFVGNVLDISDRKRAEQELHETQDMLAAVFEALPVGVGVVDQQGAMRLSNQEMHQYLPTGVMPSRDEARHARWRGSHTDGRPYARDEFPGARALRGERVVPGVELLYTGDDGSEIWTQVAAVPLRRADGAPNGQVSVVMNIDPFKRTEAALRLAEAKQRTLFDELTRSHRHLSEFLAVLAHELRNPLAPILTGLELMRMRAGSIDVVMNVRGVIERQVRQLSHLINDLLDIARVTNGKLELKKSAVDLKDIVAAAVETSVPLIDKHRHAFTVTMHEGPLPLHADPTRIAQVIGNLLTNAAKYTPDGGRIELRVERAGDEALVAVSDNGLGIPPDSLEAVFDMFSQVARNMEHSHGGLGIGLSLVRQLVGLHGGSVRADSAGAGRGSTFTVRLPLDLQAPLAQPAPVREAQADGPALRILVTDDNVDAALTLAALLELFGHQVRVAHDGAQALQISADYHPQVVFLDIGLPGMSGYEVAAALRGLDMPRCTIVAVSGWGAPDDLARAEAAGFDLHFTKPVAAARVSDFLRSLA